MTGTSEQPQRIAQELLRRVNEAEPGKGVLGAYLGLVVRTVQPDFQPQVYGVKTFREFIERYVPELQIIRFSGLDPVYGLRTEEPPASSRITSDGHDLWRIWTSPAAPLAISVNRESGEVRAALKDQPISDAEVRLPPAPFERHKSIALEFLKTHETLPDAVAGLLRQALDDPRVAWWRRWIEILRDFPDIQHNWLEYRKRALESALHAALEGAGLATTAVDRAFREVTTKTRVARRATVTVAPDKPPLSEVATTKLPVHLAALVQAVVARMSDNELRSLSLPVGVVLDVLSRGNVAR